MLEQKDHSDIIPRQVPIWCSHTSECTDFPDMCDFCNKNALRRKKSFFEEVPNGSGKAEA